MKYHTRIVLQMTDDPEVYLHISKDSFEYDGPIWKLDRSVQQQAGQAAQGAGATASGYGNQAGGIAGTLLPTLTQQATNPTGFDPTTKNQMLTQAAQATGGTNSAIQGAATENAARTRNSGALSSVLDQAARRMGQSNSQNTLAVNNESARLAQQKQQQALGELGGLYGTDVGAQFKGLAQQDQDLNTELQAGKSGWLQNTMGVLGTLGGAAADAGKAYAGFNS